MFGRVKPLDAILATAKKKSLHPTLGWFQLTLFGIGCVIGTGIFVLTSVAAEKAGPGMMYSFVIAGAVCALTALVYAEIASMVPVSGSAYTYTYGVLGEGLAWRFVVGLALAGVYPLGMKLVVSWVPQHAGAALAWLVGMLTLGTALPHGVRALDVGCRTGLMLRRPCRTVGRCRRSAPWRARPRR